MLATTQRAASPLQPQEAMRLVRSAFAADVVPCLSAREKTLPAKYFHDAAGSELFEAVCRTPEYYPTRGETALLHQVAPEIAAGIPEGAVLVEFGSGASDKTRVILDAAPQIAAYVPIDISEDALEKAAAAVSRDNTFPQKDVDMTLLTRTDHHTYCPAKAIALTTAFRLAESGQSIRWRPTKRRSQPSPRSRITSLSMQIVSMP
jgi:uncharacterized SAM-dependent methyltransferase